jgi:DNA (cytosine-5)-methyltransferase 1
MNYFNEIDKYAAQWIRNLIAARHIAPGEVDDRSISDVKPAELVGYTQCHFFAGIGGWSLALRLAGWPDDRPVWTGSCPCQPFSVAGQGAGTADERHLWPHWFHLVRALRPPTVFGEQVDAAINHGWLDLVQDDLEGEGYAFGAVGVPAAGVGAPHIRQRLWFVAEGMAHAQHDGGRSDQQEREAQGGVADGGPSWLAHANTGQRIGSQEQVRAGWTAADGGIGHGRVVDAPLDGRGQGQSHSTGVRSGDRAEGEVGRLAFDRALLGGVANNNPRLEGREPVRQRGVELAAREDGVAVELGFPYSTGPQSGNQTTPTHGHGNSTEPAGFWTPCDWLPCRDGKWRPVEPGTFPLAHGVSNRVGRLRAYGNAIVPQVAEQVIRAYMECRP